MMKLPKKPQLKTVYYGTSILIMLAGAAAKLKKDIRTHGSHEGHKACKCSDQCFSCLWD
jgi:hypothetical protein